MIRRDFTLLLHCLVLRGSRMFRELHARKISPEYERKRKKRVTFIK